jgi:L-rhamnose mutarotase
MQVDKGKLDDYLKNHNVWPEMLQAMRDCGIRNYSLFYRPGGTVVGYLEADDPQESLRKLGTTDVNRRWQEGMAKYFPAGSGDLEKGGIQWLTPYFYMP